MSNWILYTCDLGIDAAVTGTNISSPSNSFNGYEAMFSSPQASPVNYVVTLASGSVGAFAIANHNIASGSITVGGTTLTLAGYTDEGKACSAGSPVTIQVTGGTSKKIGCLSLMSGASEHAITLTNCWPTYPLGQSYGAITSDQMTGGGHIIRQRRGGAFKEFALNIPNAAIATGTTANTENMIERSYLEQYIAGNPNYGTGWTLPMWLVTDNGKWHHVQMLGAIEAPIMGAYGRANLQLHFRTVPKSGLI